MNRVNCKNVIAHQYSLSSINLELVCLLRDRRVSVRIGTRKKEIARAFGGLDRLVPRHSADGDLR